MWTYPLTLQEYDKKFHYDLITVLNNKSFHSTFTILINMNIEISTCLPKA